MGMASLPEGTQVASHWAHILLLRALWFISAIVVAIDALHPTSTVLPAASMKKVASSACPEMGSFVVDPDKSE
jgi:hypothetical protein